MRCIGILVTAVALVVGLAGCAASDKKEASNPDPIAPKGVEQDAEAVAAELKKAIPEISKIVVLGEADDTNDLFGRPGQYDQLVFLADSRFAEGYGCDTPNFDDYGIDCGGKVERWPTAADAKSRMDDIQQKLKSFGLGAEWDYLYGRVLVRVGGDLKPSDAAAYKKAVEALK